MNSRVVKQKLFDLEVTKAALAKEMGIDASTLWRFLSGKNVNPRKPFLVALEIALKNLEARINADSISKENTCVNRISTHNTKPTYNSCKTQ